MKNYVALSAIAGLSLLITVARADVGDPQIRTDHPWYPGELAISNFDRLFETQVKIYERVTGREVKTDQDKALASWLWRNTHYWHGEAGKRDLWGEGIASGKDGRLREYWNGLFGYGFGLCGTTHSQWTAEFNQLLGHGRSRGVGAAGHNAFEVFLQGAHYGKKGRWSLLDHDLSTVLFDDSGQRLLGLGEIQGQVDRWIDRKYKPEKQQGWLVCGLHPADGNSYRKYAVAEYLAGYAGPPPMVHLRRGERMRRYFEPGLEDGETFVFWGRNYNTDGIMGPERARTWVNQPDKMHRSENGTPHRNGQARFANVKYIYRPDFSSSDYREGLVEQTSDYLTLGFHTPYIIGATPPNNETWGIYDDGCTNGLLLSGKTVMEVTISVDAGRTWSKPHKLENKLDLTDLVKGRSQYWLRLGAGAGQLIDSTLEIRTVCQANIAVLPRLKDNGTTITFEASGNSVTSLGPEVSLAKTFLVDGGFGEKHLTLEATPRGRVSEIHAAAHVASGSPPDPKIRYQIDFSLDSGATWLPVIKDWVVLRQGNEPGDFWSQSFCYGSCETNSKPGQSIQIRFHNDGGKRYLRAEAHLIQKRELPDPVKVSYHWTEKSGERHASEVFDSRGTWQLETGQDVQTRWVEFEPVAR